MLYPNCVAVMAHSYAETTRVCDGSDCDQPTPWDMVGIQIAAESFCSPDCARQHLETQRVAPDQITLHDPQFHLSRDSVPGPVSSDTVNIACVVTDVDDAVCGVDELESMFPARFRVADDE